MKKRLIFFLMLLSLCSGAQEKYLGRYDADPKADFFSDSLNFGGICRGYNGGSSQLTPAPKGYEPFYLSHYGRHGSRYLHREDYYSDPYNALKAGHDKGVLTPLGESVMERVKFMYDQAKGHIGDLTPRGAREQKGIAHRMYANFPEILKGKDVDVFLRSTTSPRVILSMAEFSEGFREVNPRMNIYREASASNSYLNQEYPVFYSDSTYAVSEKFIADHFDMDHFKDVLYTDRAFADGLENLDYAAWRLYMLNTSTVNLDYDFDFNDLFRPEDNYILWEATNLLMYQRCAISPINGKYSSESGRALLRNIIECADAAIAGENEYDADIRFGHDMYLIPLVALLGINDAYVTVPEDVASQWRDYRVSPKGGNVQLVFYKNKEGDVLVKCMLNEDEVPLGIPTDIFPYYHWSELRSWLMTR